VGKRIDGLYICGNTGQAMALSVEERTRIAEAVKDQVKGRVSVITHVGAIATRDAKRLVAHANELQLDGISSLPPVYPRFSDDEVVQYYRDINAGSRLPCLAYHWAAGNAPTLSMSTMLRLLEIEQIVGLKYTAPDFFWMQDLLRRTESTWIAFSGADELFLPGLTMGTVGSIGSTQNIFPELFLEIHSLFKAGNWAGAMQKQRLVTRIVALLLEHRTAFLHTVKHRRGMEQSYCRAPVKAALSKDAEAAVDRELAEIMHAAGLK